MPVVYASRVCMSRMYHAGGVKFATRQSDYFRNLKQIWGWKKTK